MQPLDRDHGLKELNGRQDAGGKAKNPSEFQLLSCTRASSVIGAAKISTHLCCYGKLVHSGVIIAILEELMSRTARAFLKGAPHSTQMNFAFMKPLENTGTLKAEGRILNVGESGALGLTTIEGVIMNSRKEVAVRSTSEWIVEPPSACDGP